MSRLSLCRGVRSLLEQTKFRKGDVACAWVPFLELVGSRRISGLAARLTSFLRRPKADIQLSHHHSWAPLITSDSANCNVRNHVSTIPCHLHNQAPMAQALDDATGKLVRRCCGIQEAWLKVIHLCPYKRTTTGKLCLSGLVPISSTGMRGS